MADELKEDAMAAIKITMGELELLADLNESDTADAILAALPITGSASTWGDEIYFGIPVVADEEEGARVVVAKGELAYWPPGSAFCIFWGATPVSRSRDEIRAASEVNPLGQLRTVPVAELRAVGMGETVLIELVEE
ncbi:MAG TPA: cyclophilin-like fold protein [Chloroflexota bacterium]|nr:cyclophilin-like fold protein [Chloroflexota bacterium]